MNTSKVSARQARIALMALLVSLALVGCTNAPPQPSPVDVPSSGVPSATAAPQPVASPSSEASLEYNLAGDTFGKVVDSGPRDGARGTTTTNAEGELATYTVAPNDDYESVPKRFGLSVQVFFSLNAVRRSSLMKYFVGDTLNLNPHTITSVGTENGKVYDFPTPSPMPEQY